MKFGVFKELCDKSEIGLRITITGSNRTLYCGYGTVLDSEFDNYGVESFSISKKFHNELDVIILDR